MIMQKLRQFMYGRYGTDQLAMGLLIAGLLCGIISMFTGSVLLYYLSFVFYAFEIYRMLSKNIEKRRSENMKFMQLVWKVKNFFTGLKAKAELRKKYKYFKCPACGQKIRIPRGRGKVEVRCPKCSHSFIKKV